MKQGMTVEIDIRDDSVDIICSGPTTASEIVACIDRLDDIKRTHPEVERCLIDCRATQFDIDLFGRFTIGEYAARKLAGRRLWIALLARPEQITRMVENTAHNRGLRMFTTSDVAEARAWLAEGRRGSPSTVH
jgi:hypothetical protein